MKEIKKVFYIKIFLAFIIIAVTTVLVLIIKPNPKNYVFKIESSPSYRQKAKNKEKIVIYEFSDFACPACQRMHFYLKELIDYFPDIKIEFKHYPLTEIHPYAFKASLWAECSGIKYSKFWEFADILFKERNKWSNNQEHEKLFESYAKSLSMDVNILKECVNKDDTYKLIKKDMEEGDKLGVDSTPTFFVNGKKAVGGMELIERLKEVIR